MKYFIFTLGCQLNKSDAQKIETVLKKLNFKASSEKEADLLLAVACSVRQKAIDRIYGRINKWEKLKKGRKDIKTILTGCVLPPDKKKLKKKFDIIFDIKDLPKLPQILNLKADFYPSLEDYFKIPSTPSSSFQAFVPIMTGCDNFCSFCVVPYTRGREKSRPSKEILEEIKNLIQKGYKEITLVGTNINSYGKDLKENINFAQLLQKINEIPGDFWIRFITSTPKDMTDELIKVLGEKNKICEFLNLPIQSGDNEILKKMNRKYTVEEYKEIIDKVKKTNPNIALATDIIVGFPSEKEKQFQNTVKLLKEIQYDMVYIAEYSPRPLTFAFKYLKDDIPKKEKERRRKILEEILRESAYNKNKKLEGKIVEVLVEKAKKTPSSQFLNIGRTRTNKPVHFLAGRNLLGKFVKVKITKAKIWGLKGVLI